MDKKIAVISCTLWILGLAAFIVGLNLPSPAKDWFTVIGTIVFLLGLGGQGILWAKKSRSSDSAAPEEGKEKDAPKDA